ncbi:MAG: helix-turn-helix domain-containing protein, partial [candidate division WOR-3 bacterium]
MPPIASYYYIVAKGKDQTVKYEIRHSMVLLALKEGIKPTARYYGVSRNTVRKWLRRYRESRIDGLEDRSRASHHIPRKTSARVERKVVRLRWKLKRFGSRQLVRDYAPGCSHGAFDRIYREQGLLRRR